MDSHYSGESPQKEDVYLRELSTKNKMAPKHTASIVSKGESGKETVTGSSKWAQFLEDKISSEDEEDEDSNLEEASVLDPAQEHKVHVGYFLDKYTNLEPCLKFELCLLQ